jgi:MFS family permease
MSTALQPAKPGRPLLVLSLGLSAVIVSMMQTLSVPILPSIENRLHTSSSPASWVTTAALLSAAVCTPLLTRLGDQRGKRRVLIGVLLVAVLGSALATATTSLPPLLAARAMQGSATAIFPLALSILRDELPPARLPAAMGAVSSTLAVGAGLALVGAGALTQGANPDYHRVFLFATLLTAVALAAAVLVVPPSATKAGGRTDWAGAGALAAALALLLLPLSQGNAWGWASARTVACLAGAIAAGAAWVLIERRTREPLVDLGMFVLRPVVLTNISGTFLGFGMFTQYIGISSFAQTSAHLAGYGFSASPLRASVQFLLPATAASLITGQLIGVFVRRFGARLPLAVGACSGVIGFTVLAFAHSSAACVMIAATLTGAAVSSGFATLPAFIAAGVPAHQSGIANGLNSIARSTGSSVASAVIATLLAADTLPHLPAGSPAVPRETQYTFVFLLAAVAFAAVAVIAVAFLNLPRPRPLAGPHGDCSPTASI